MRSPALARALGVAVLFAALATPGAAAAPPRAVVVPCGAVLTSSVRLAADVVCPSGGGITLAADGIELNLNGHALVGPGIDVPLTGVVVAARDVVVRNGTVRGWGTGVRAEVLEDSPTPPYPAPSRSAVVRETRLQGNSSGAAASFAGELVVRGSTLVDNRTGGWAQFGGRLRVENSTVERNREGLSSFQIARDGLVVRNSLIRDNRSSGVSCGQDGRYDVVASTLQRNRIGLNVFECSGQVADSKFIWNGRHVEGYLMAEQDTTYLCHNTYTRDGLPVRLPYETTGCTSAR